MKKIALVRTKKESSWVSCQSIVNNLEQAYISSSGKDCVTTFYIDHESDNFQIYRLTQVCLKENISEIIFIDHRPHPINILTCFNKLLPDFKPKFTFHIFGDFVLESTKWNEIDSLLKNYITTFICASQKQKDLLDSFINKSVVTQVAPFPIQSSTFYFDDAERSKVREKLGLTDDDFLFLYTGRISLQKNVLELAKAMGNCSKICGNALHFYFAGPFDDLGTPYKGQENPPGAYFQRWVKINESLSNKNINYIHNLDHNELRGIYNAADFFVSLSTHNDEDYGMSPAEALMCGLPVILSDWGGYSSFKRIGKENCHLIPVKHQNKRLLPDLMTVQKIILKNMEAKLSLNERKILAKHSFEHLSIESIAHRLKDISVPIECFPGFNSHFFKLSSIFQSNPYQPFSGPFGDYSEYFFEVYHPYMKEIENG